MKKYSINSDKRVVALRDFGNVMVGDIGGFVDSEKNLSHNGNCWIYDNAKVTGNAKVTENSRVCGTARVFGNSRVYGDALVCGNSRVSGTAWVCGDADVFGTAWVSGDALVSGNAEVFGKSVVTKSPFNVYNGELYRYNITLTDNNIHIGCRTMRITTLLKLLESNQLYYDTDRYKISEAKFNNIIELLETILPKLYLTELLEFDITRLTGVTKQW